AAKTTTRLKTSSCARHSNRSSCHRRCTPSGPRGREPAHTPLDSAATTSKGRRSAVAHLSPVGASPGTLRPASLPAHPQQHCNHCAHSRHDAAPAEPARAMRRATAPSDLVHDVGTAARLTSVRQLDEELDLVAVGIVQVHALGEAVVELEEDHRSRGFEVSNSPSDSPILNATCASPAECRSGDGPWCPSSMTAKS